MTNAGSNKKIATQDTHSGKRKHGSRIVIAVFTFEGINPFFLSPPLRVFREASVLAVDVQVDVILFATTPGRISLDAVDPLDLTIRHGLEALRDADLVIIPSWYGADVMAPAALTAAIRDAHARGARLAGLCLGVFVLAQAGILDGNPATTMPAFAASFSRQFPRVHLDREAIYVEAGNVTTSAGRAVAMDCCLALADKLFGIKVADQIAENLVSAPTRVGERAHILRPLAVSSERDRRLLQLMDWMKGHLGEPLSVETLAARANMNPRTFARHFQRCAGATPKRWLTRERFAHARALLHNSDLTVEAIAINSGFGSAMAFRKQFKAIFGIRPSAYRSKRALEHSIAVRP